MRSACKSGAASSGLERVLPLGILLGGLAACEPAPAPLQEPEIIRLDPGEAARLAREVRQEVSARVAGGLELSLWAPEQLLIDPIGLTVDDQGDVYVTGSNRSGIMVDIRWHPTWTTEALSFQTVEDLRSFYRRELAPERSEENAEWLPDLNEDGIHDWRDLTVQTERIYRIRDTSGDGLADMSELLLEGFNTEVSDVAGGVFVHQGAIYVAAAPDLWRLRDTSGDGLIDSKESISHGYSVHPGFFGHGMSGVTLGPDGRIYWGTGDIGFTVVDGDGRRWSLPNQGAILRSEPDGSGFEIFAMGLRNTHEFDFDEHGNLISVDNDGDMPPDEVERVVYIVEGSDSGWRVNWQFGKYTDPENNAYNVWMREGLFRPRFPGQAAYITPPIASYGNGPSGFAYNPGTALSERWRNHFFIALFSGTPARSSVRAFRLEEKGATFDLARDTLVLDGLLTTGMAFGPDGALYLADWVDGWGSTGSGRIWKLDDPTVIGSAQRDETRALLAEAFDRRSESGLAELLGHDDMRVRLKAQLELASRSAAATLHAAVSQKQHRLARLHGLWGIGQLARADVENAEPFIAFLSDDDAEVRAQTAKMIGDVRYEPAAAALVALLADPMPRVRFFAAEALGRIGHGPAVQPLIAMLEANNDEDAYLRHAGSLALARIGEAEPVIALAAHESRALRIAAVVALRRMQHPGVARFLQDEDEYIVTEAARAINDDSSIEAALPELARVLEDERFQGEPLLRRALNANLRVGTAEAAHRVASFAARTTAPEPMRVDAIAALAVWPRPSPLDRVDGIWHGPVERDASIARAAVEPLVTPILDGATAPLKVALASATARLSMDSAVPSLMARVQTDPSPDVRIAALNALHVLRAEPIEAATRAAFADRDESVRKAALTLISDLGLPEESAVELLASVLERGSIEERKSALEALGGIEGTHGQPVMAGLVDQLTSGTLAPELELELFQAVEASNVAELRDRLANHRAAASEDGPIGTFHDALRGGNAERGREVMFGNQEAQCMRCHSIDGEGSDVGPALDRIGATLAREQLLEALVDPTARIAPGFGTVSVTLEDGQTIRGTLREETSSHIVVQTADGEDETITSSRIAERTNAPSAMPPMGRIMSRREIRDVVEYLSTLK